LLGAVQELQLGGQNLPPALQHLALAQPAGGLTAAPRRDEDLLGVQGGQQRVAALHLEGFLGVDQHLAHPVVGQVLVGHQDEPGQKKDQPHKGADSHQIHTQGHGNAPTV
jgi:hypothetical protein